MACQSQSSHFFAELQWTKTAYNFDQWSKRAERNDLNSIATEDLKISLMMLGLCLLSLLILLLTLTFHLFIRVTTIISTGNLETLYASIFIYVF